MITAHTQLRLAVPLSTDQRKPWEKSSRPGLGRPPGSKNRHPATRHDVGKTVKRPSTLYERDQTQR